MVRWVAACWLVAVSSSGNLLASKKWVDFERCAKLKKKCEEGGGACGKGEWSGVDVGWVDGGRHTLGGPRRVVAALAVVWKQIGIWDEFPRLKMAAGEADWIVF